MADSRIQVGTSNEYLETSKFTNSNGKLVHREGVFIGSGSSDVKTNVTSGGSLQVFSDPAQLDAFARLRVSNPETIFNSKQINNDGALFWDDQEVSGSGTSSTWTQNTASTVLGVSATTAGRRVRQTFRRFNYQPGKSQLTILTGTLKSGGGAGITRSMGLYDDKNGIFVRDNEGTLQVVKRSYTTGEAVDTAVGQSAWSLDPMDGTGPSGVTLDPTKSQIFFIDFEWLGVGRVRCGWFIDGLPVYCHEFLHANNTSGVYMSTPNLPLRYEIENDGTGVASELESICATVMSEGGTQIVGLSRSFSTGNTFINANTAGTTYAICGIRLKAANLDGILSVIETSVMISSADDYIWHLYFNPTVAGTAISWTDMPNSIVQTAIAETANPSTNTVTGGTMVSSGFIKAGKESGSINIAVDTAQQLGAAIDGTPDEIWLCVTPLSTGADAYGAMDWKELT